MNSLEWQGQDSEAPGKLDTTRVLKCRLSLRKAGQRVHEQYGESSRTSQTFPYIGTIGIVSQGGQYRRDGPSTILLTFQHSFR